MRGIGIDCEPIMRSVASILLQWVTECLLSLLGMLYATKVVLLGSGCSIVFLPFVGERQQSEVLLRPDLHEAWVSHLGLLVSVGVEGTIILVVFVGGPVVFKGRQLIDGLLQVIHGGNLYLLSPFLLQKAWIILAEPSKHCVSLNSSTIKIYRYTQFKIKALIHFSSLIQKQKKDHSFLEQPSDAIADFLFYYKLKIEEMEYILTEEDISYCRQAIEDLDDQGNGYISIYDLETALQRLDLHFEEFQLCKLISELDNDNQGIVYFQQILEIYQKKRQSEVYGENDQVTLDAYTAIGGPADKSGHIDGEVLVKIIKKQFQLPIDIEELIREVDDSGNGQIEYEQFQKMLKDNSCFKMK